MLPHFCQRWILQFVFARCFFVLVLLTAGIAAAQTQPVAVRLADDGSGADLSPNFLGLSYEMSMLLPKDGRYYFDPDDRALEMQ